MTSILWNDIYKDLIGSIAQFTTHQENATLISNLNKHWKSIIYNTNTVWHNRIVNPVYIITSTLPKPFYLKYINTLSFTDHNRYSTHRGWLNIQYPCFNNITILYCDVNLQFNLQKISCILQNLHRLLTIHLKIDCGSDRLYKDINGNYSFLKQEICKLFLERLPKSCCIQSLCFENVSHSNAWKKQDYNNMIPLCSQIKTLEISDKTIDDTNIQIDRFLPLIESCKLLTSLTLCFSMRKSLDLNKIKTWFSSSNVNLPNLTELNIDESVYFLIGKYFPISIQTNLSSMRFYRKDPCNDIYAYAAKAGHKYTNVIHLQLPFIVQVQDLHYIENISILFPNLKILDLPAFDRYGHALDCFNNLIEFITLIPTLHTIRLHKDAYNQIIHPNTNTTNKNYVQKYDEFTSNLNRVLKIITIYHQ